MIVMWKYQIFANTNTSIGIVSNTNTDITIWVDTDITIWVRTNTITTATLL